MFMQRTTSAVLMTMGLLMVTISGPAFGVQDTANTNTQHALSSAVYDTTSTALTVSPAAPRSGIARTFVEWTEQGGWVMYPIYGVFIHGLGINIYQFIRE